MLKALSEERDLSEAAALDVVLDLPVRMAKARGWELDWIAEQSQAAVFRASAGQPLLLRAEQEQG